MTGTGRVRIYEGMWWTVSNLLDDGLIEANTTTPLFPPKMRALHFMVPPVPA